MTQVIECIDFANRKNDFLFDADQVGPRKLLRNSTLAKTYIGQGFQPIGAFA